GDAFHCLARDERPVRRHVDLQAERGRALHEVEEIGTQEDLAAREVNLSAAELAELGEDAAPTLRGERVLTLRLPVLAHHTAQVAARRDLDIGAAQKRRRRRLRIGEALSEIL